MKRSTKKLLGFVAAGFLAAVAIVPGLGTLKAGATPNYTPVTGTETTFKKHLVIPKDSTVPNLIFAYSITAGNQVLGDDTHVPVYAGDDAGRVIGAPTIADEQAKFTPADDAHTIDGTDTDGIANSTEKKYATKDITIDFSSVKYKEPGVYRYIVHEDDQTPSGVTFDTELDRTLDVNVEDSNGSLVVSSYVMYYGNLATAQHKTDVKMANNKKNAKALDNASTAEDESIQVGDKCDNYVNSWPAQNLYIGKSIAGNQASKDKYFRFTVALSNAGSGTHIAVAGNYNATDTLTSEVNGATTIIDGTTGYQNPSTITTDANQEATVVFYLQGNQYVKLMGLPENAEYTVTEDSYVTDGYVSEATKPAAGTEPEVSFTIIDGTENLKFVNATTGTIGTVDVLTGYINTKQGTIPTGVILSVAPWAIAGVVILAGVVFFAIRSRKKYEEE